MHRPPLVLACTAGCPAAARGCRAVIRRRDNRLDYTASGLLPSSGPGNMNGVGEDGITVSSQRYIILWVLTGSPGSSSEKISLGVEIDPKLGLNSTGFRQSTWKRREMDSGSRKLVALRAILSLASTRETISFRHRRWNFSVGRTSRAEEADSSE